MSTLGETIEKLQKLSSENPRLGFGDKIESLSQEYHFMFDFMKRGYADPKRKELYDSMRKRGWVLMNDIQLAIEFQKDSYLQGVKKTTERLDTSSSGLIELLNSEKEKNKSYYTRLTAVFTSIFISNQWTEQDSRLWTAYLLSTDVDVEAACVVVSAITMSCRLSFCLEKFRTLANVYMMTDIEAIRQRALVGWAFSFDMSQKEFEKEQEDILSQLAEDGEKTCRNVLEMLMQIVRCTHAEKDDKKFQNEIMPKLMEGQPIKVTENGIIEKTEDPLEDILNPGASEKRMERLEKHMKEAMAMQNSGADLYYNGFAQTKRYPFFYNIMNWFLPYSNDIPEVKETLDKLDTAEFIKRVADLGPFCDSDKFSLVFTFNHVMGSISPEIKKMMNAGDLAPVGMAKNNTERLNSPTFIQRIYLQDLYRFFKLFPQHSFPTIFDKQDDHISLLFSYLGKDMKSLAVEYASFLIRQEEYDKVYKLFKFLDDRNYEDNVVFAALYQSEKKYHFANIYYLRATKINPEEAKAYKGLGKCAFAEEKYELAAEAYKKLKEFDPGNKNYDLNYVMSMVNAGKAEEMLNEAYRLDFEISNNLNVKRLVGWTLLMAKRLEQADKVLTEIANDTYGEHQPSDELNLAYSKWLGGDLPSTLTLLNNYIYKEYKEKSLDGKIDSLSNDIKKDYILFDKYSFTQDDINLVLECIRL